MRNERKREDRKGRKGKGRGVVPNPKQKSDCATVPPQSRNKRDL